MDKKWENICKKRLGELVGGLNSGSFAYLGSYLTSLNFSFSIYKMGINIFYSYYED
jgi:hypothetical protein